MSAALPTIRILSDTFLVDAAHDRLLLAADHTRQLDMSLMYPTINGAYLQFLYDPKEKRQVLPKNDGKPLEKNLLYLEIPAVLDPVGKERQAGTPPRNIPLTYALLSHMRHTARPVRRVKLLGDEFFLDFENYALTDCSNLHNKIDFLKIALRRNDCKLMLFYHMAKRNIPKKGDDLLQSAVLLLESPLKTDRKWYLLKHLKHRQEYLDLLRRTKKDAPDASKNARHPCIINRPLHHLRQESDP